jgi:hypothetical protein
MLSEFFDVNSADFFKSVEVLDINVNLAKRKIAVYIKPPYILEPGAIECIKDAFKKEYNSENAVISRSFALFTKKDISIFLTPFLLSTNKSTIFLKLLQQF